MIIDHIAIYTDKLEELRNFYVTYFGGISNNLYVNEKKQFRSYFLSFESGARLEIMSMPNIPDNANVLKNMQYKGITHFAFAVKTIEEVDDKAKQLQQAGYKIIDGPRKTGDGYYEFVGLDPDNNRIEVTTKF